MTARTVLFLCTGNSARSIMAEALMNHLGAPRFKAYSAGSHPAGAVNPFAERLLKERHIWSADYYSKNWDVFAEEGAPEMDIIITVCDNAAGEVCPIWPGRPAAAHWGFEDPAAHPGPDAEKMAFFVEIFGQIRHRIDAFLALPIEDLDTDMLKARLAAIGAADPVSA